MCLCVGGGEGAGDTLEVTCAGRDDLGVLRISADGLPEKDSSRITGTTQFTWLTGTKVQILRFLHFCGRLVWDRGQSHIRACVTGTKVLALLVQKYLRDDLGVFPISADGSRIRGTIQFTCFTGTKVQVLTLRGGWGAGGEVSDGVRLWTQFTCVTGTKAQILTLRGGRRRADGAVSDGVRV
jgi:hypothetical protein